MELFKIQGSRKNNAGYKITEDIGTTLDGIDEKRLPWPGGIKQEYEKLDIQTNKFNEEILKNKLFGFYKYLIEKVA